jgi:hypothetical protein
LTASAALVQTANDERLLCAALLKGSSDRRNVCSLTSGNNATFMAGLDMPKTDAIGTVERLKSKIPMPKLETDGARDAN